MYADDLLLTTASIQNLQKLVTIAEKCFEEINLKFNVKKCAAMRNGRRCKVACSNIALKDGLIPWNFEIKYLGVVLSQASYLKINNLHSHEVGFFCSFNSIFAKVGNSNNVDTVVELMKCNCLSVAYYYTASKL